MNTAMTGYAGAPSSTPMKALKGSRYSPEQIQLLRGQFDLAGPQSYTARLAGGDPSLFEEIERPAMQQFNQLQGDIASRFSGAGMGARHGSGFKNEMNQQSIDFATNLQSQRQQLQRQAIQDLMGMSNELLGYDFSQPKKKKWWQSLLGGVAPLAGAAIGAFGGPLGSAIGGLAGSAIGGAFNDQQPAQMDFSQLANLPRSWGNAPGSGLGSNALRSGTMYG